MWRKRRSALLIDFENVGSKVSPASIAAMTAWLEDGKFDAIGGKRRLVSKRIYWNSSAEKYREVFEAAGFEVVLCEKFSSMKNGADIRMALDVLDTCWMMPEIKEYILFKRIATSFRSCKGWPRGRSSRPFSSMKRKWTRIRHSASMRMSWYRCESWSARA